ncbi:hypothetical protein STAFG_7555 [Streptomyces afghaniensis 772]|uniref:Serine/threonine protein kinase n=1 Tax=Streptomyces afghaniensis 772 TaxID=1283301 RepID=S4NBC4_9ACTN|nr:hypothetical protein STAFG_7555 [Streptomyces afghaniensis 772]
MEGTPPYDKGSAIATLTAVMTEPLEEPKNAGPLRDVIHGLLTKDPAKRLDDAGARAMLNSVIHAPATAEPEPMDATKVVPLPAQPDKSSRKGSPAGSGGKRSEEAGERLRGALRSVRKAAVGTAGASAASRTGSEGGTTASAPAGGKAGAGDAGASVPESGSASESASGATGGAGAQGAKAEPGGRSSGWPVMQRPDLPPRPAPRAPLTDVVPRRTMMIIAAVVVLAVIGTVLAIALSGDDKDPKGAAGESGGKTVATASSSADTKGDKSDGTRTDSTATQPAPSGPASNSTPSGRASESSGGGKGTAAESTHQGSQGYSIGLPKGWKYQSTGAAGDRFTGPDGQKLLIAWTSTPKGDPVADWKSQERYMQRAQYKKIRIEQVDYRGWNTADWEFTYVESGTKYRTIDRGFVVDDRQGYALMYTAKAAGWGGELRKQTWRTLTKTFEPKS